MMKRFFKISLVALVVLAGCIWIFKSQLFKESNIHPMSEASSHDPDAAGGEGENDEGIAGALQYYAMMKANPVTKRVDLKDVYSIYNQLDKRPQNKMGSILQWTEMGPDNVGGRCRGIIIDHHNSNLLYAGGVSGGVWRSFNGGGTWSRYGGSDVKNINVTTLCQSASGAIYYGTGEIDNLLVFDGGIGNSGFVGLGIFKVNPGDANPQFQQLTSTNPGNWPANHVWSNVNKILADPTDAGRLYAANDGGIYITDDSGTTWKRANINAGNVIGRDLAMSNDGQTIYASVVNSNRVYCTILRSDDRGATWKKLNGIDASAYYYTIAISPQDNNYVYLLSVSTRTGGLAHIYKSTDKGETWQTIANGDAVFNPLAAQGNYDACIAVDPTNKDHVVIGGLNVWDGKIVNGSYQWQQLSNWKSEFYSDNQTRNPYYVHADQHTLLFDNTPTHALYIATDGGISKSTNVTTEDNPTFFNSDYGFNTIQFYGIGVSATDKLEVIGGSQDNGVIKVNKGGITLLNGNGLKQGDGGYCAISKINPQEYIGEYTNGDISRSFSQGSTQESWTRFYDKGIPHPLPAPGNDYPFITDFVLWESLNDPNSVDSVIYSDEDHNHKAGETISVHSNSGGDFNYVLQKDLPKGSAIYIRDIIQSKFFVGSLYAIYMTKQATALGTAPEFYKILSFNSAFSIHDMEVTPDGNSLFVAGTTGAGFGTGEIYYITGLAGKHYQFVNGTFDPADIGITSRVIFLQNNQFATGLALDPNNPNHLIATFGNYGYTNHVFESKNATDSVPVFKSIQHNLPPFPVYDALINFKNPNMYFLATEFGVWSSKNGGVSWQEENEGLDRVPVFQLQQRHFPNNGGPTIYACTHGRGVFMSETLSELGIPNANSKEANNNFPIQLYPNPAVSFAHVSLHLSHPSDVAIQIFNLSGQMISENNYGRQPAGEHTFKMATSQLAKGAYLIHVKTGEGGGTASLLVMK